MPAFLAASMRVVVYYFHSWIVLKIYLHLHNLFIFPDKAYIGCCAVFG